MDSIFLFLISSCSFWSRRCVSEYHLFMDRTHSKFLLTKQSGALLEALFAATSRGALSRCAGGGTRDLFPLLSTFQLTFVT